MVKNYLEITFYFLVVSYCPEPISMPHLEEKKSDRPRKLFFHGSGNCMQDLEMENNVFEKNMCFLKNASGGFTQRLPPSQLQLREWEFTVLFKPCHKHRAFGIQILT